MQNYIIAQLIYNGNNLFKSMTDASVHTHTHIYKYWKLCQVMLCAMDYVYLHTNTTHLYTYTQKSKQRAPNTIQHQMLQMKFTWACYLQSYEEGVYCIQNRIEATHCKMYKHANRAAAAAVPSVWKKSIKVSQTSAQIQIEFQLKFRIR